MNDVWNDFYKSTFCCYHWKKNMAAIGIWTFDQYKELPPLHTENKNWFRFCFSEWLSVLTDTF